MNLLQSPLRTKRGCLTIPFMTPDQREFARGVAYRSLSRAVAVVNEELGTDFVLADCEKTPEQLAAFREASRGLGKDMARIMLDPDYDPRNPDVGVEDKRSASLSRA